MSAMSSVYTLLLIKQNNETSFFLSSFDGRWNVRNDNVPISDWLINAQYLTRVENYRAAETGIPINVWRRPPLMYVHT